VSKGREMISLFATHKPVLRQSRLFLSRGWSPYFSTISNLSNNGNDEEEHSFRKVILGMTPNLAKYYNESTHSGQSMPLAFNLHRRWLNQSTAQTLTRKQEVIIRKYTGYSSTKVISQTERAERDRLKDSKTETSSGPSRASKSTSDSPRKKYSQQTKNVPQQVRDAIMSASKSLAIFLLKLPGWTSWYLTHPTELRNKLKEIWELIKHEVHHYWMGTKLLIADVRTARKLLNRTLQGSSLTRRERKQLLRTVSDLFRLVPFSMFVLIPFMEFALPLALRLFPNMLPSTFQDSLRAEENMKRELQSRLAMASFFQETLQEMAKEQKKNATRKREEKTSRIEDNLSQHEEDSLLQEKEQSAAAMLDFLDSARSGQILPADVIIQFASHFHDDLTLDNMPRMQLMNMCQYMNIPPYGADSFLRFQLRHKIRSLVEDDQRILWEGINSLTKMELREACQERGMRSTGLSKDAYKLALQQWLHLSVNKHVPISLLIMSRSFFLREEMSDHDVSVEEKAVAGLADAISGLDQDVVNEVVLEVATSEEKMSDPEIAKIKLEVLEAQNERILEEQQERDAKKKKEEKKEKEKIVEESMISENSGSALSDIDATHQMSMYEEKITEEQEITQEEDILSEEEVLSPQEMDAISQLVSPDPVTKEKEELKRIKAAMLEEERKEEEEEQVEDIEQQETGGKMIEEYIKEECKESATITDETVAATIIATDQAIAAESDDTNKIEFEGGVFVKEEPEKVTTAEPGVEEESGDEGLDIAISTLKARIFKMVNKIETQIDKYEEKIGDKLHLLDKDGDGIISMEEIAEALEVVLKRDITHEEAMAIAALIDEDHDGIATLEEFTKWIETNKIIQLLREGKDGDLDRLLDGQKSDKKLSEQQPSVEPASQQGRL